MQLPKGADRPPRRTLRIVIPAYPAFNIYSSVARVTTALGPVSVATAVNDIPGWDAEVIDENNYRRGPKDEAGRPDHAALQRIRPAHVVGLYGGLTSTIPRLYEVAEFYKALGVPTVAGGQHFVEDTIGEALGRGVDFIVLGEGEKIIGELLAHFDGRKERGDIRGIAYLEGGKVVRTPDAELLMCFDELPIPDFSLVRYARIRLYPVGRVRGCVMNCEFCTVKGRPRYASPERLMQQFALLFETRGAKWFFIVDDLFGQDREETLRLCKLLGDYQRQVGTRFKISAQIRLDKAHDAELLQAMRYAGINMVAIGFESPITEELKAMNKRLNPEDMVAMTRLYRRAGFRVHGMFIFGYPAHPGQPFRMGAAERVRRFRRFIKKSRLDTVQVLLPVPLPGTELTRRLRAEGRVYSTDYVGWEYYDGNFPLFDPDEPMTAEEMQASIRRIMGRFYRPGHILSIGLHTLSLPVVVLWLHNIKAGWRLWVRRWWKNVLGYGGAIVVRRWTAKLKTGTYHQKLAEAEAALGKGGNRWPARMFPLTAARRAREGRALGPSLPAPQKNRALTTRVDTAPDDVRGKTRQDVKDVHAEDREQGEPDASSGMPKAIYTPPSSPCQEKNGGKNHLHERGTMGRMMMSATDRAVSPRNLQSGTHGRPEDGDCL